MNSQPPFRKKKGGIRGRRPLRRTILFHRSCAVSPLCSGILMYSSHPASRSLSSSKNRSTLCLRTSREAENPTARTVLFVWPGRMQTWNSLAWRLTPSTEACLLVT